MCRPITRTKFLIEKLPKTYKNDMNLLIFLDLTYNPCKNLKFYSLQGQNVQIFLIFTYNQGKIFLILPIIRGGVCLVSTGSCPPPPVLNTVMASSRHIDCQISYPQLQLQYSIFLNIRSYTMNFKGLIAVCFKFFQ